MRGPEDIDRVRRYFRQLSHSEPASTVVSNVTPKVIGGFYDRYLAHTSPEDAPRRFMNYGYWHDRVKNKQEAQENLIERLVAGLPNRDGRILDAACGTGATAHYLTRYWRPACIFGINISAKQLDLCWRNSSCRNVAVMDAGVMSFSDSSFENIVCVEAAFHFDTRENFLRECSRILTKGGILALTDILLHKEGHELLPMWLRSNYVPSLSDYQSLLLSVGFSQVKVIDITDEGWNSYARNAIAALHDAWISGRSSFPALQANLSWIYRLVAAQKYNLMCFAKK